MMPIPSQVDSNFTRMNCAVYGFVSLALEAQQLRRCPSEFLIGARAVTSRCATGRFMRHYTAACEAALILSTSSLAISTSLDSPYILATILFFCIHTIQFYLTYSNSIMFPGQFPSPTPSREGSPVLPRRDRRISANPARITKNRATSLNFTAPTSNRKRPRFAAPNSEPVLSDHIESPISRPQTASNQGTNGRRVSDPLPNRTGRPQTPTDTQDSAPSTTPICPRRTDIKLEEKLSDHLTRKDKKGVVYVIRDVARPQLGIKIGITAGPDYQNRINQHGRDCFFKPDVIHVSPEVQCCKRLETLIHIDLEERCRKWTCKDHARRAKDVEHEEWFDISEELAKETVEKWTQFIHAQQPYFWRKRLSPLWAYLIRTRKLTNLDTISHKARSAHWHTNLAPPTYLDYYRFIVDAVLRMWHTILDTCSDIWPYCTGFFWQMLTVIYGFVTLLAFRNTFASSAFALVSVCACISVVPRLPKMRSKS
jgi:hypothetical protein